MSSRILDPDTPFEPMPWHAASDDSARQVSGGGGKPQGPAHGGHHPAHESSGGGGDQARIRELEGAVKLLERRIEDEKRTARDQGHQQGLAAGVQQEAAKWTDALGRLGRAVEEISKSKARFRAEVEEDAVKLALAIARKVLNRELVSDSEALTGLARVALDKLNMRELQRVRVHPADAPAIARLIEPASGPKRVEVVGDNTLERGAAIFETERGMLDASVTTQLGEIERGLADMLGGTPK